MDYLLSAKNVVDSTKFGSDNRGTKACDVCGKVTWASVIDRGTGGTGLCAACYNEAGSYNLHVDEITTKIPMDEQRAQHRAIDPGYAEICPICYPERSEKRIARVAADNEKKAQVRAAKPVKLTINQMEMLPGEAVSFPSVEEFEKNGTQIQIKSTDRWWQSQRTVEDLVQRARFDDGAKCSKVKTDDRWTFAYQIKEQRGSKWVVTRVLVARHKA
jgi:hypothetical protein